MSLLFHVFAAPRVERLPGNAEVPTTSGHACLAQGNSCVTFGM